jgi:hypothetical protein
MKATKNLILIILAISLFAPSGLVHADIAPPMDPPGGGINPENLTQVEMLAEQVLMDFRESGADVANVSAWFIMRNTGSTDEHLAVRFPLNGDGSIRLKNPLITDFKVWTGSTELSYTTIEDPDDKAGEIYMGNSYIKMHWAVFDVDFPAGVDVKISVKYTVKASSWDADTFMQVMYILSTGEGWKNPIGSVDIILRLPFTLHNDYLTPSSSFLSGASIYENEIRFHYDALEPKENFYIELIKPQLWLKLLQARTGVISMPNDSYAWQNLAQAYYPLNKAMNNCQGDRFVTQYFEAYHRAIELNPNNANLHISLAREILEGWFADRCATNNDYLQTVIRNELATALQLSPGNDAVENLKQKYWVWIGDQLPTPGPLLEYPTTTPTLDLSPTPAAMLETTSTVIPAEATGLPSSSPTNAQMLDEEKQNQTLPWLFLFGSFISGAVLVVLVFILVIRYRLRKRENTH